MFLRPLIFKCRVIWKKILYCASVFAVICFEKADRNQAKKRIDDTLNYDTTSAMNIAA